MISWKIWRIHRQVHGHAVAGVRIYGIMAVIIESGTRPCPPCPYARSHLPAGLYSGLLVYLIVTTVLGHPALWIVLNSISPMIVSHRRR